MAKKQVSRVKKKKKSTQSGIVIAFGCIALVYFLAQAFKVVFGVSGIETVAATHVTVDDAVTATGYFLRDETVIAGANSDTVEHVVHNGEKVFAGASLAVEYADQAALETNRQIKSLTNEISMMQTAISSIGDLSDTAKLDQLITVQMQTLAKQTHDGMVTDINEDAASLRQLVLRRVAGSENVQTLQTQLDTLKQQKAALQSTDSVKTTVISSPVAGYFSDTVDGYESVLTPASVENMTVSSLQEMLSVQAKPDESALGKVMRGFSWYFATSVASADAVDLKVGNTYTLRFAQVSQEVKTTLYAVRADAQAERTLLVFQSDIVNSELLSMRQQVVDIIKGTYSGIKVPKSALRTVDDQLGVYILSGSVQRFKKVSTVYEGDTFFVIQSSNKADADAVVQQDEIIVKARGLTDKKVVK